MQTMDPILPRAPHQPHAAEHEHAEVAHHGQSFKKRSGKKRLLKIVAVIIPVMILGGVTAWFFWVRSPDLIPSNIRKSVSFSLYQPAHLPNGFALDKSSFNSSQQVVTFTVTYGNNKKLIFIEQPKPTQLNFSDFTQQLSNAQQLTLPIGQAAVGTYQGVGLGTIASDQTWILVRAPSGIDTYSFENIIRNMR